MSPPSGTPARGSPIPAKGAMERLRQLVQSIGDPAFAGRLYKVYEAAERAIAGLGDMELGKYSEMTETGAPDLSMWEELAPVIRDTVVDVNGLLSKVRELFPTGGAEGSGGISELIGDAIEAAAASNSTEARLEAGKQEAVEHVHALAATLAREITNLGERMRTPQVVSDRWNLLGDLQEFRGKFRSAAADLIYLSAICFQEVRREEIIPGWREEIQEAVTTRRAVTDLSRLLTMHHQRLAGAPVGQRVHMAQALLKDLDAFGRSRAYVMLRTADKRCFVEFRALLSGFQDESDFARVVKAVGEFVEFSKGLSHINKRSSLVEHDRELLASLSVMLEQIELQRETDPVVALAGVQDVVKRAIELYGRTPSLDTYLRRVKKRDLAALNPAELAAEVEQLRVLIAQSMME